MGVAINNPVGSVSVKPAPVNAVDAFGLASVNLSILLAPCAIGEVKKALERVGSTGRGQPVMVTLSMPNEAAGLFDDAPIALILNVVVPAPVDTAA